VIATFSNSQGSELGPIETMERKFDKYILISKESIISNSRVKDYYLRDQTKLVDLDTDIAITSETLQTIRDSFEGEEAIAILTSKEEWRRRAKGLA
jgi:hypothetical protein